MAGKKVKRLAAMFLTILLAAGQGFVAQPVLASTFMAQSVTNKNDMSIAEYVSYTIEYHSNFDNDAVNTVKGVTPGDDVTVPGTDTMTRKGYAFTGWNTKADGSGKAYGPGERVPNGFSDKAGVTVKLYGQWDKKSYSIILKGYDANGEPITSSSQGEGAEIPFDYGDKVTIPDAKKPGWTFVDWKDPDRKKYKGTVDSSDLLGGDDSKDKSIVLEPEFKKSVYHVAFDVNGGKLPDEGVPSADTEYTIDDSITLPTPSFTGHTFTGWKVHTKGLFTGKVAMKDVIGDGEPEGTITFKAIWDNKIYHINYDTDGNTSGKKVIIIDNTHQSDESKRITDGDVTADKTVENGAYVYKDGSWTDDHGLPNVNIHVKDGKEPGEGDIIIVCDDPGRHVFVTDNSHQSDPDLKIYTGDVTAVSTVPEGKYTWNSSANDGQGGWKNENGDVISGITVINGKVPGDGDQIVIVDVPDDAGKSDGNKQVAEIDDLITLPKAPTKEGWTFDHWKYNGKSYKAGSTVKIKDLLGDTEAEDGNINFEAVWNENEYTLTFDGGNDAVVTGSPVKVKYTEVVTLPVPERTGYTFTGWYRNNTDGSKAVSLDAETTKVHMKDIINGGKDEPSYIFHTKWVQQSYLINLRGLEGTTYPEDEYSSYITIYNNQDAEQKKININGTSTYKISDAKVDYTGHILLPVPQKDGYMFKGWYINGKGPYGIGYNRQVVYVKDVVTGDEADNILVFTAKWEEMQQIPQIYVSYDSQGANSLAGQWINYNEDIIIQDPGKKKGYSFAGYKSSQLGDAGATFTSGQTVAVKDLLSNDVKSRIDSKTYTSADRFVTLTAGWKPNTYTIHLDTNGGLAKDDIKSGYATTTKLPTSPEMKKDGYTFTGWYRDPSLIGSVYTTVSPSSLGLDPYSDGEITLYAKWQATTAQPSGAKQNGTLFWAEPNE